MARKKHWHRTRYSAMVGGFAEMEIGSINRFRQHVLDHYKNEMKDIDRRASNTEPDDPYLEVLSEEVYQLKDTLNLANQLAIVALYRVVESCTALILRKCFGENKAKKASNVRELSKFLVQQSVDLNRVPHFRVADELRLLNNAVKHAGKVTSDLGQKYKRWKRGAALVHLDAAYDRLSPRVPSYLKRLAQRLKTDKKR